jgi:UDP-N-acetylmuramoyl-tripeptide--D-alanyl-D-alanine ligase
MNNSIEQIYSIYKKFPQISTDSRNIKPNSIFFAIKGDNFDGNSFAAQALESGAKYAVVDNPDFCLNDNCILVENTITALQQLALLHRKTLKIPILGITGSNGKTTTKELLFSVVSKKFKTLATTGNLNNHIGVPLTVLSIKPDHEFAIIEMGANHVGEIGELCSIAQPDFGIITNIGKAHLEGFGGPEGVIKTKNDLYLSIKQNNGTVFVNHNNDLLMQLSNEIKRFTYGNNKEADYYGDVTLNNPFLEISFTYKNDTYNIKSKIFGAFNFENIMAAVSVGLYFEINPNLIISAIEEYIPSNNRSQLVKTQKNTIILDAYNANPTSMKNSIENFVNQSFDKKVLILGDMLELGEYSGEEHKNIINLIKNLKLYKTILVGNEFYKQKSNENIDYFINLEDVISFLKQLDINNAHILLKGSRKIGLEKLLPYL